MTDTTPLSEVKRHDALGLPREVMAIIGAPTQTFAAIRALARNTAETFASIRVIADRACLEERTVKRHLKKLCKAKVIKHKGRERRRTPTYTMDSWYVGSNDRAKFAILPRWAAWMLETWAERTVFALIVSRDSLNDVITNDTACGDDTYGRLQYPATTLAKDCGLSLRAIGIAKANLARLGIIKIDPAMLWQDERGRLRTMADTLMLNPDFQVPNELLTRCANLSLNRSAKVSHCQQSTNPTDTLHHGAKVALDRAKMSLT